MPTIYTNQNIYFKYKQNKLNSFSSWGLTCLYTYICSLFEFKKNQIATKSRESGNRIYIERIRLVWSVTASLRIVFYV